MPNPSPPLKHPLQESFAISAVILLLILTGVLTWRAFNELQRTRLMVRHTYEVLQSLERIEAAIKDAETGQRGFLITGREDYLEPFETAVKRMDGLLDEAATLTNDNPVQQARIEPLKSLIAQWIGELRTAIETHRQGGMESAKLAVNTHTGKQTMDRILAVASKMRDAENELLADREAVAKDAYRSGLLTSVLSTIFALGMVAAVLYLIQYNRRQAEQAALQLQAEKENLRVTLLSIGDAVIATDLTGRVTSMNAVAETLTGWTSDEAQGELLTRVFHIVNETTRLPVDNPAMRALAEGSIVGLANHTVLIAKNGNEWPIDDSAAPICDTEGQLFGSVLVFRDISQRKHEEAQTAERQRLVALRADISTACSASHKTPTALQQTCEAVVEHLDMAFARVWTLNESSAVLELQASAGLYTHLDGPHCRVPVGQYKIGRIASNRQPHLSNSVPDDPEVSDQDWAKREGMIAFAGYPLLVENRVVGVLAMFSRHRLSDGILKELKPIGDFVAQFIDRRFQEASRADAQAKLKVSEERVRLALDSANLGTWNIDPRTQQLISDARFQEIFGRPGESITYEQAFEYLHPDDRAMVAQKIAAATNPTDPEPYDVEYRVVLPDGSDRWVAAKGRANFEGDEVTSFDGTLADITELKRVDELRREVESQFQMLADHIPQLAWIAKAGSEGEVDWFNRNWYDFTGMTPEQILSDGWHSVHHPEHAERVILKFREHVRDNVDWEDIFPIRGKDGEYRWFLSRMKAIRDQAGKVLRIFGTSTDVTEQQNLAESLRQTAAELSEADRRKNEFLATLAHELRNPLAPIKNAVQLMGMTKLDEETEDLRQTMARQVEQLVRLIDDLLDVSRISRGKIVLRREVIDLASIVEAAVEASDSLVSDNAQELVVNCPSDETFVQVDAARITQVVSNLLNNAAKYSGPGCRIKLSVSQENQQAVIRIRDNGIGIEAERLQDIFQMFSQVNDSLERGSAGLGIGLTLVKTLVEMHGGSVSAESEGLGTGSTFTVRLPLTQLRAASQSPTKVAAPENQRSFKILIVEDQRALRVVLTRLLEKMGHEVESVDGGIAALVVVNDYRPDLVFSDISMPGMTGYELAKQLRQRDDMHDVYFVAMTGYGQETDRNLAIESGFDEHMVKPVDVDRLQDLFNRLQ